MRKVLLIIIVCLLISSLIHPLSSQTIKVPYFPDETVILQSPASIHWLNPTLPRDEVPIDSYCFLGGTDGFDTLYVNNMMYTQTWIKSTTEDTMQARVYFPQGQNKFYIVGRSASRFFYSDSFLINIREQPPIPKNLRLIEAGWDSSMIKNIALTDSAMIKHGYLVWDWDAVQDILKGDSIFYCLYTNGSGTSGIILQTQYRQTKKNFFYVPYLDSPSLLQELIQDGDMLKIQIISYVLRDVAPPDYPGQIIQLLPSNPSPVYQFIVNLPKDTTQDDTTPVIYDFELYQNYPNPFNSTTTIQFTLPEASLAVLKIYNLLGQKIYTLTNQELAAGEHQLNWHAQDLAAGIYIYQLESGGFKQTRKMILIK